MTHLEFDCSDEKATALLRAARLFDEEKELQPVKHAEWLDGEHVEWFRWLHKCSLCGGEQETASDYCPNCGAKMDGGHSDGQT